MKATILSVQRTRASPQLDIVVEYRDDLRGFTLTRVLSYGDVLVLGDDPEKVVRQEILRIGQEYQKTLANESLLLDRLLLVEIDF